VTPLLKKIRGDLASNLTGIWEDEQINQLDPNYSKGILSPGRHVRTRLYFTSESHIYSLLTVLKFGQLFEEERGGKDDSQWENALQYLSTVPELNYLTQIVIMLYEDPSIDDLNSEKRFHVEIHFSPGAYADFDAPKYLRKTPSINKEDSKEEIRSRLNSSTGSNDLSVRSVSPKAAPIDKKSPLKNITKKFPIKFLNKELQTLHEPPSTPDISFSASADMSLMEHSLSNETKPRSFEDEHHQNRIQAIRGKMNTKDSTYNHYNTFHGSGSGSTNNYLPLSHVFKNKTSQNTNSSPDLNQNLLIRNKKSLTSKLY
jgi:hypothetical protein